MLGKREPQRDLFGVENLLTGHVGQDSFYAFLSREGSRIFRDQDFAGLYGKHGRPSVPPSQLCMLLILQHRYGVSDQEAVDRTAFDLRWKVALGVEVEDRLCAKSTLQLFRARLLLNERFTKVFEASVRACRRAGLGKGPSIDVGIDTTPVLGRGAVKDTYNLVSDGIRAVVREVCRLKSWAIDETVASNGLDKHFGTSFKGESDLDWSDPEEKAALLQQLVADAQVTLSVGRKALRGYAKDAPVASELRKAQELLQSLLAQDLDDPGGDEGPRIRRGTERDRIISVTDPEMRHGHKSHSKSFDGYKASVVVDVESGVVLATDVRAANVADRDSSTDLVKAARKTAGVPIASVLGDTAYGDAKTRADLEGIGVEVIAKAPPINSKGGVFKRDLFKVDEDRGVARCPAKVTSIRRSRVRAGDGWTYYFSRNDCGPCALREQCTTAQKAARTITVTEASKELDVHRKAQKTRRFRNRYRRRVSVEHAIGRMRQKGLGQARYFGAKKVAMQAALTAATVNLNLAAVCPHRRGVVWPLFRLQGQELPELRPTAAA